MIQLQKQDTGSDEPKWVDVQPDDLAFRMSTPSGVSMMDMIALLRGDEAFLYDGLYRIVSVDQDGLRKS